MRVRIQAVLVTAVVTLAIGAPSAIAGATDEAGDPTPSAPTVHKTASDFNGDGYSDLAVSSTAEDGGVGLVQVLYGSATGLTSTGNQLLRQGTGGLPGTPSTNDKFGDSMAWGDFNADGKSDLAIGADGDTVGSKAFAGTVTVVPGSNSGLLLNKAKVISQATRGVVGDPTANQFFGETLTTGNFGHGPETDLAIGDREADVGIATSAGTVHVVYGGPKGITGKNAQMFSNATKHVPGSPIDNGYLAVALAGGNFGKTSFADLAIGNPGATSSGQSDAGAVIVLYGSKNGITTSGAQRWSQGSGGILDTADANDFFGDALAAGNIGRTSTADLAVGIPQEDVGIYSAAGQVQVIFGTNTGLKSSHNRVINEGVGFVPDTQANQDFFGSTLAIGNLGYSSTQDLVIGVPDDGVGGLVIVLYNSKAALGGDSFEEWTQDSGTVQDAVEAGDFFGNAVAIGNYGSTSTNDLAIGVHSEDLPAGANAGAVHILFGTTTGLTDVGNQFWSQDTAGIQDQVEASDFWGQVLA